MLRLLLLLAVAAVSGFTPRIQSGVPSLQFWSTQTSSRFKDSRPLATERQLWSSKSSPLQEGVVGVEEKVEEEEEKSESAEEVAQRLDGLVYQAASCMLMIAVTAAFVGVLQPLAAQAMTAGQTKAQFDMFDPSQFQPVCPGSDGVYNILKFSANSLVGADNVVEYGPLIASVLLRVRLELCVLESFIYEAVVPFVRTKGISWILPLHETVETVLAGTIFAVASNFILLGSTKILSVLFIYADAITGMPTRFLGGQVKKNLKGVPSIVGAGFKAYGDTLGALRGFLESADTFVGRYLVIGTTLYVAFKICHYKLFNDIF